MTELEEIYFDENLSKMERVMQMADYLHKKGDIHQQLYFAIRDAYDEKNSTSGSTEQLRLLDDLGRIENFLKIKEYKSEKIQHILDIYKQSYKVYPAKFMDEFHARMVRAFGSEGALLYCDIRSLL